MIDGTGHQICPFGGDQIGPSTLYIRARLVRMVIRAIDFAGTVISPVVVNPEIVPKRILSPDPYRRPPAPPFRMELAA